MVDLFVDRVLVKKSTDQNELDTERQIAMRLQNRILMLYFASAACESCQQFAPTLTDFFECLEQSEEQQESFLKELPKKCLFLAYEVPHRRDLKAMFNVEELPTVVVLYPDCSILIPNAVKKILCHGPDCYPNWQEAVELIDRNFMISEDFEGKSMCSLSYPVRKLKYKVKDKKKKKKKKKDRWWGGGGEEDAEVDGGADGKDRGGSSG